MKYANNAVIRSFNSLTLFAQNQNITRPPQEKFLPALIILH